MGQRPQQWQYDYTLVGSAAAAMLAKVTLFGEQLRLLLNAMAPVQGEGAPRTLTELPQLEHFRVVSRSRCDTEVPGSTSSGG